MFDVAITGETRGAARMRFKSLPDGAEQGLAQQGLGSHRNTGINLANGTRLALPAPLQTGRRLSADTRQKDLGGRSHQQIAQIGERVW